MNLHDLTLSFQIFLHARIHTGLAGSNDIENAEIWAIMEVILDTANDWIKVRNEKDETRKVSRLASLCCFVGHTAIQLVCVL